MVNKSNLKQLMDVPGVILAPGAHDPLAARMVAQAGYRCVFMTGFGVSAALLGKPDLGYLGLVEMATHAGNMVDAIDVPLIADAEDGFGGALNALRTVKEFEQRGVSGLHIEDQASPKRCAFLGPAPVIPRQEYVGKIAAAVEARASTEFLVIARIDAYPTLGIDEVIGRANECLTAGAGAVFVTGELAMAEDERTRLYESVDGPLMRTLGGPKSVDVEADLSGLDQLPHKIVAIPHMTIMAAAQAMRTALSTLNEEDSYLAVRQQVMPYSEFTNVIGLEDEARMAVERFHAPG